MRRKFLFLLPLAALSGCATGPSLQSRMAAYIGGDEQTLVQSLGVPDKQITVNGIEYLAYDRHHEEVTPGAYLGGFYGPYSGFYDGGFYPEVYDSTLQPRIILYDCEITFLLKNGRVFNFTLRGNDCG